MQASLRQEIQETRQFLWPWAHGWDLTARLWWDWARAEAAKKPSTGSGAGACVRSQLPWCSVPAGCSLQGSEHPVGGQRHVAGVGIHGPFSARRAPSCPAVEQGTELDAAGCIAVGNSSGSKAQQVLRADSWALRYGVIGAALISPLPSALPSVN